MILIDKEKLIEEVSKRNYSKASLQLIQDQPEVMAIPVEWIKIKAFENPSLNRNLFFRLIIGEWERVKENARD